MIVIRMKGLIWKHVYDCMDNQDGTHGLKSPIPEDERPKIQEQHGRSLLTNQLIIKVSNIFRSPRYFLG